MHYRKIIWIALWAVFAHLSQTYSQNLPHNSHITHVDKPFLQEFSIKYTGTENDLKFLEVSSDRNGVIQVLTDKGLFRTHAGEMLYPGSLVPDRTYLPMKDKNLMGMKTIDHQFVYLDDRAVFSNAWTGSRYVDHTIENASLFEKGMDFTFLISDGLSLELVQEDKVLWKGQIPEGSILDMQFDEQRNVFYLLSVNGVFSYSPLNHTLEKIINGTDFTCFDLRKLNNRLVIGTKKGYFEVDLIHKSKIGETNESLPWPELNVVKEINGLLWFGSERGAFMLKEDGMFNYYDGMRWLPGEKVVQINEGTKDEVLILTDKGLGKLVFTHQTLAEKAHYYGQQVRSRHIRYGFNATLEGMDFGNVDTGRLGDSDNDGLWTSMYLAGEVFRYAVTGEREALQNVKESLDAMERLYTINPIPGFPSRSFSRSGYIPQLSDPERWQHSEDPEWDWKATTSSDEAIGHLFVFGVIAELIKEEGIRAKAIQLMDELMQHIVDNDWYLIDYDGQPTTWGRWHPDYVNGFATMVGDRKLNSSNIIAMLQTAYHFTNKEIYMEKALMLMNDHGYLENLMRPMEEIGKAEEGSDDWAAMLSESWNHSDDEMYFLGYWGLYRYAFDEELKNNYRKAIKDHWESERPEKEGLWNIFTAMVSPGEFDLEEAIWYLKEYPLDLINWTVKNSHRKDIELLDPNFRKQRTAKVLPPDELSIRRHNANRFELDGGNNGASENSAGDIWLLPYWMGRYLGVISEPVTN
ncbi:MAG: hypothetical protein WD398_13505 [Cyclobacteriaceae bacterium]